MESMMKWWFLNMVEQTKEKTEQIQLGVSSFLFFFLFFFLLYFTLLNRTDSFVLICALMLPRTVTVYMLFVYYSNDVRTSVCMYVIFTLLTLRFVKGKKTHECSIDKTNATVILFVCNKASTCHNHNVYVVSMCFLSESYLKNCAL